MPVVFAAKRTQKEREAMGLQMNYNHEFITRRERNNLPKQKKLCSQEFLED